MQTQGNGAAVMRPPARVYEPAVTPHLLHTAIVSAVEHAGLERKIHTQRSKIQSQRVELARSQRISQAILDSAAYMIVATDARGTVPAFNPAAERQLGYAADEVIGRQTPLLALVVPLILVGMVDGRRGVRQRRTFAAR